MSIISHIIGIINKNKFINHFSNFNNVHIIDLDLLFNSIDNNNDLINLFTLFDEYTEKSKTDKSYKSKSRDIQKKMNNKWKTIILDHINGIVKSYPNKFIIIIGKSHHPNNTKIFVNINAISKFYINFNIDEVVKNTISNNIDNYKTNIINGTFPIDYISYNFLYQQIKNSKSFYKNLHYTFNSYNYIIQSITNHINYFNNYNHFKLKLFVSSFDNYNDIISSDNNDVIYAYDNELISIYNLCDINFTDIKNISVDDINKLNKDCFIYTVDISNFLYIGNNKFITNNSIKIINKFNINILNRLKEYKVNIT